MRRETIQVASVLLLIVVTSLAQDGGSTQRVKFENGKLPHTLKVPSI